MTKSSTSQAGERTRIAVKTFNDLRPGALFRWRSNLGGQDTMRKVGEHDLLNLKTGNRYRVDAATHFFGQADPVIELA